MSGIAAGAGPTTSELVHAGRRMRIRRRRRVTTILAVVVAAVWLSAVMFGDTVYSPLDIVRVIAGEQVPGASFTLGRLRLPRATVGLAAGAAFGIAGITFQQLLRNPLASPDIIGISTGASAAAVFGIVILGLDEGATSLLALGAALGTAVLIYALSIRGGFAGTRLILIGIGIAAMLQSVVAYVLSRAAAWDIQTAMQWLSGSLNGASWASGLPLLIALGLLGPLLIGRSRSVQTMSLGDDSAASLGVRVERTRILMILAAVALLAFATAAAGPIAFVAFMSGPIAARLVGPGGSLVLPSALVGALLVLVADLAGQYLLGGRYPVGVVTGILGAPYLISLLVRRNRQGGSL